MEKIAVGGNLPKGVVDLDNSVAENLANVAKAKKMEIVDVVVCIPDRPRHGDLIAEVREAGARIMLIGDGDVSGHRDLPADQRGRYLHGFRRRSGRRSGGRCITLHRRPDASQACFNDDERGRATRLGITDFRPEI